MSTVTWTNATGNGIWNDAGNWDTGTLPGASDVVVIGNAAPVAIAPYYPTAAVAGSLTTNGARIDVLGTTLTVSGQLQASQTFIFISSGVDQSGAVINQGAFLGNTAADPGAYWVFEIGGIVAFSGQVTGSGDTFAFTSAQGSTLRFGAQGTHFDGDIYQFAPGNTIDLTQLAYDPGDMIAATSSGAWTITDATGATLFTFANIIQPWGRLVLSPDGTGGTAITAFPTFIWTGVYANFSTGGDWSDPRNWAPLGVPGLGANAGADVVIDRTTYTAAGPYITSITIGLSIGNLTLVGRSDSPAGVTDFGGLTATGITLDAYGQYLEEANGTIGTAANPAAATVVIADQGELAVAPALGTPALLTVHGQIKAGAGTIIIGQGGALIADGASLTNGTIATWSGDKYSLGTTVRLEGGATLIFNNAVTADPYALTGQFALGSTFYFTDVPGQTNTLILSHQGNSFQPFITGFGTGDVIDLASLSYSSADTITGTPGHAWTIDAADGTVLFTFAGGIALAGGAGGLMLTGDASTGTEVIAVGQSPITIAAPAVLAIFNGPVQPVIPVRIVDTGAAAGVTFTVTVSDTAGLLTATGATGSGTTTLTLTGSLDQVNAALATLTVSEATAATDSISLTVADSLGNQAVRSINLIATPPVPVLTAPPTALLTQGHPTLVAGISLAEPGSLPTDVFTVTAQDTAGLLSASGSGVSGSGTNILSVSGTAAQVNAALATLTDTDSAPVAGPTRTDSIALTVTDSSQHTARATIGVTVAALRPVFTAPSTLTLTLGNPGPVAGLSIAEPGAVAGETFGVLVSDNVGLLAATGPGVMGLPPALLLISGSLDQVNAALATLTDTIAAAAFLAPVTDTLQLQVSDGFNNTSGTSVAVTAEPGFTWTPHAGSYWLWDDPNNWTPNSVPGLGITLGVNVTVDTAGTSSASILAADPPISLTTLSITGNAAQGDLVNGGNLTVTSLMSLNNGVFASTGASNTTIGTATTSGTTTTLRLVNSTLELGSRYSQSSVTVEGQVQSTKSSIDVFGGGGTVSVDTSNDTKTTWNLYGTASLRFVGQVAGNGDTFAFEQPNPVPFGLTAATLTFGAQGSGFAGSVTGFGVGDVIDLKGVFFDPNNPTATTTITGSSGGSWTIHRADGTTAFTFGTITLANKADTLIVTPDGQNGVEVTIGLPSRALDGYIAGATVFADANGNGLPDAGEASTTTDSSGRFLLSGGSGPLVLTGGTDTSTNLAFTGRLTAPAGSAVVTPLTTLVETLATTGANPPSVAAAEQEVLTAFGLTLPGGSTPDNFDPIAGLAAGLPGSAAAYAAGTEVYDTVSMAAAALAGLDPALSGAQAQADVFAAIAGRIASSAAALDLTDAATVRDVVAAAAALDLAAAAPPSAQQIDQIGAVIAASNALAQQAATQALPADVARGLAQVARVAQGEAAPALSNPANFAAAVAAYTGAALAQAVADAAACFLAGTLIRTPDGETAVENLRIGDRITTLHRGTQPVKWIGRRSYLGRFLASKQAVLPIRIPRGVLGEGLPVRDLLVSPKHAMFIDGALVPAGSLVDGVAVTRERGLDRVDYFHIELDAHDIIFAEGAPTETFVDCDNRGMFQNAEEFAALYPDGQPLRWAFCAERVDGGPVLAMIRARLGLVPLRPASATTTDPALHLVVDNCLVLPVSSTDGTALFQIEDGARTVRLVSRSVIPAEYGLSSDKRCLGVAVTSIVLSSATGRIVLGAEACCLTDGFHPAEGGHRWTSGDAGVPFEVVAALACPITMEVHFIPASCYPLEGADVLAAA